MIDVLILLLELKWIGLDVLKLNGWTVIEMGYTMIVIIVLALQLELR